MLLFWARVALSAHAVASFIFELYATRNCFCRSKNSSVS